MKIVNKQYCLTQYIDCYKYYITKQQGEFWLPLLLSYIINFITYQQNPYYSFTSKQLLNIPILLNKKPSLV